MRRQRVCSIDHAAAVTFYEQHTSERSGLLNAGACCSSLAALYYSPVNDVGLPVAELEHRVNRLPPRAWHVTFKASCDVLVYPPR
jgi:hypothetical protein